MLYICIYRCPDGGRMYVCMYIVGGGAEAAFSMHNTNTYLGATRPYNNNNKIFLNI